MSPSVVHLDQTSRGAFLSNKGRNGRKRQDEAVEEQVERYAQQVREHVHGDSEAAKERNPGIGVVLCRI